jgi:hypothetical protein
MRSYENTTTVFDWKPANNCQYLLRHRIFNGTRLYHIIPNKIQKPCFWSSKFEYRFLVRECKEPLKRLPAKSPEVSLLTNQNSSIEQDGSSIAVDYVIEMESIIKWRPRWHWPICSHHTQIRWGHEPIGTQKNSGKPCILAPGKPFKSSVCQNCDPHYLILMRVAVFWSIVQI